MKWLYQASIAAGLGSGFKIAIALWYLAGLNRGAATVKLKGSVLRRFGVNRHAGYRGLAALESAGLVEVERRPGQTPLVTLVSNQKAD